MTDQLPKRMTFEQLRQAYETRHPGGKLFSNLRQPKGRFIVTLERSLDVKGALEFYRLKYSVHDVVPGPPGWCDQTYTLLMLWADTLEEAKLAPLRF